MTRYQVDSEAVFSTTGLVRGNIARIQAEVAALHGHLSALQASWTGEASSAFQVAFATWKGTETQVEESLAGLNLALGQAGQQYAEIEAANARLFVR